LRFTVSCVVKDELIHDLQIQLNSLSLGVFDDTICDKWERRLHRIEYVRTMTAIISLQVVSFRVWSSRLLKLTNNAVLMTVRDPSLEMGITGSRLALTGEVK
jgi:hypothetical protein